MNHVLTVAPNSWKKWVAALRPPTLLVGLSPVLIGLGFAWRSRLTGETPFAWSAAAAAVLLVIFLQSAANLVNDAKDAEKGIDQGPRLGPPRVVHSGWLSARAVKRAYYLCFAAAGAIAALLFWQAPDYLMLEVAAACGLAAYAYTAGPFPLAYYALGESVALVFFGPVAVMGTSYLHTHRVDGSLAFWGVGSGCIAAAIMAINNARDRDGDARAGKHTLATLSSEVGARRIPLVLLGVSALFFTLYGQAHDALITGFILSGLAALYIARFLVPLLQAGPPMRLNLALKRTALFNFLYALAFIYLIAM